MTITILCAGSLSLPGGSDDAVRPGLLARHSPPASGAMARLIARARAPRLSRDDSLVPGELPDERWLRERFGVDAEASIAAFAGLADARADAEPSLVVRPVHLHVGIDHLVLAVPQPGEIDADEADALADAANRLFAEDELRWSADTPQTWSLRATGESGRQRLAALARLRCRSARLAAGRNISVWQPEGDAARTWRALVNELQMLWFEHAVNQARERAGRPVLNSVWLEGRAGAARTRAFDAVITADDAVAGLALACGAEVSALAPQADAADFARLAAVQEDAETVLIDPGWWRQAMVAADAGAWQDGWRQLDALVAKLTAGGQSVKTIVLGGERDLLEFALRPGDRWAMWRRRALPSLLANHR